MKINQTPPPLTKEEKEVCYLTWGGIPMTKGWQRPDVEWIRKSNLFQSKMRENGYEPLNFIKI